MRFRLVRIEICVHCWKYTRLLCYQLSSLYLFVPKKVQITATVFYSSDDKETAELLNWFREPLMTVGVALNPWELPKRFILRRSIGRHEAAIATKADWIWMADADYLFGEHCLDSLPDLLKSIDGPLAFPRYVLTSKTHETGDDAISRVVHPAVYDIERDDFHPRRMRRAIGGVQIYRGMIARELGYLPPGPSGHAPVDGDRFLKCREDVLFRRRQLQTSGTAIDAKNVFRIRHTACGRNVAGLKL